MKQKLHIITRKWRKAGRSFTQASMSAEAAVRRFSTAVADLPQVEG